VSEGQGGWGQQPGGQPPEQPGWGQPGQQPPPPPPPPQQPGWGAPPPPPPQQPGWGAAPPPPTGYGPPPGAPAPTNGLAVGSLIAGIIAFFTGWIFIGILIGIAAIVMGILARKKPGGRGLAIAGIVTGAFGILWGVIVIAILVFAAENIDDFDNVFDCLNQADTQAEIDQCEEDFNDDFGN
jgi:hypothetical protein